MQQTLDEEKETDAKLTQLAEQGVNEEAEVGDGAEADNGAHRRKARAGR